MCAEELECDWSKVTTEYPTPGQSVARQRTWGAYSTGGSRGIRESHEYVRQGGASARMMLTQAAANEWKVPVSEVTVDKGVITHKASNRTTTYGKVAEAAAKLPVPEKPALKDPKSWKIAGKPVKARRRRRQGDRKQVYGADLRLPECSMRQSGSPVFGGKVKSFDAAKVEGMPGVKGGAAGDRRGRRGGHAWHAKTALDALLIVWDEGPNAKVSSASIAEIPRPGSTPNRPLSATRTAMQRRPSPAQRKGSRPSTPTRIRTTPRWSR
jgi:isoquinoline 1-oxidoreductase beta subunit